jgi:isoamylase
LASFGLGCHQLEVHLSEISARATLIVTPRRAFTPDDWDGTSRDWAVTAQLYSLRSARNLVERDLTNYWGYNTVGFFAPDPRYAHEREQTLREFKEMVARFHDAGLEVILDVVYNHTAEGNERGPTLSFKGIDNAFYYRLIPGQPRYYINDTGTGNTLNLIHMRVIQMVTDSLRYWVTETHVDGFRFDLGTILARERAASTIRAGS